MAKHNYVGKVGEDIASEFLKGGGHTIVSRNFKKPYGEIDIISRKGRKLFFWEVKTVSYETNSSSNGDVPHETHRPEDNVHKEKLKKLARVIESYLFSHETVGEWEFGVIALFVDMKTKQAQIRIIKNIIIGD